LISEGVHALWGVKPLRGGGKQAIFWL